jgi:hypothetical protein
MCAESGKFKPGGGPGCRPPTSLVSRPGNGGAAEVRLPPLLTVVFRAAAPGDRGNNAATGRLEAETHLPFKRNVPVALANICARRAPVLETAPSSG